MQWCYFAGNDAKKHRTKLATLKYIILNINLFNIKYWLIMKYILVLYIITILWRLTIGGLDTSHKSYAFGMNVEFT